MIRFHVRPFLALTLAMLAAAPAAHAQYSWTGDNDNNWAVDGNWTNPGFPGAGDTALFTDIGSNFNISLGGVARPIGNLIFDSLNTNTYSLGVLASGDQFDVDAGGSIVLNSGVTIPQTINAAINSPGGLIVTNSATAPGGLTLAGNVTTADLLNVSNNSTGSTLTFGGNISAPTSTINAADGMIVYNGSQAMSGPVTISGAGAVTFNGAMTGTGSLATTQTGPLSLNAPSTYSGGTTIGPLAAQTNIRIGADSVVTGGSITSGPFGTGMVTHTGTLPPIYQPIGADRTIANDYTFSQGMFVATAPVDVDPTGPHSLTFTGNMSQSASRTFTNNLVAGAVLTLGSADTPGTYNRTAGTTTFQSQSLAGPGGGVTVLNHTFTGTTGSITIKNGINMTVNSVMTGMAINVTRDLPAGANATATFNNTLDGAGLITVERGSTADFNGVITGTRALEVNTSSVVTLDTPHTYSGATDLRGDSANLALGGGTLYVTNTTGSATGTGAVNIRTGTLGGTGIIGGNVSVLHSTNGDSHLAPGVNGAGRLTIGGNLSFNGTSNCANCNFDVEIGGTIPGTEYDQVAVGGTLTIGSTSAARADLNVTLIDDFTTPTEDTTFTILAFASQVNPTFGFANVNLPDANWSIEYTPTAVLLHVMGIDVGLEGDYNGDGFVDAADYVVWRKDPANNGGDPQGYTTWVENFGESQLGSGGNNDSGAVPEPTTLLLVGLSAAVLSAVRPRRRSAG